MKLTCLLALIACPCLALTACRAQGVSFDGYTFYEADDLSAESATLPDPFRKPEGGRVSSLEEWEAQKTYIRAALQFYLYGSRPTFRLERAQVLSEGAEGAHAITRVCRLYYDDARSFRVRITRPATTGDTPLPVLLRFEDNMSFRFPFESEVLRHGRYIVVAVNHLDVAPSEREQYNATHMQEGEAKAIMAWAHAATLTLDYLETLPFADMGRVAITGHSRTGKAALCAAAFDERFALCNPNSSGAAGASTLRALEEGSQHGGIAVHQPSWVAGRLADFVEDLDALPLDVHWAQMLIAPRTLLLTESRDGADSRWAGLRGTYAAFSAAEAAWQFYGAEGHHLIHTRAGSHDQTEADYDLFIQVCDHAFYGEPLDTAPLRSLEEYPEAPAHHTYTKPF